MTPLISIVIALAAGAAAIHQSTIIDQAILNSYAKLKRLIQRKYPQVRINLLEYNPYSADREHRQAIVQEELMAVEADHDAEVLQLAQILLEIIQPHDAAKLATAIGVNLKDIKEASLTIGRLTGAYGAGSGGSFGAGDVQPSRRTSRGNFDSGPPIARDLVDCTAFAPQSLEFGEQALIQVFVHAPEQIRKLKAVAVEADPAARRRGATILSTEIALGSRLKFALNIPGFLIDEPVQEVVWRGTRLSVQFLITAPHSLVTGLFSLGPRIAGVATISASQEGVVIGQIKFILPIERKASNSGNLQITGEAQRYHTAFISYASQNRPEVLRYVQMLRLVGISYFQDLLSLDPGQRWAQQLYHHIDTSDVFFLFWPTPAKQSKWVTKEWRYGLKQKGLDFIKPVMIEGPPPVPPPKALAKLHFNDWLLYVIRAEEAARGNSTLAK